MYNMQYDLKLFLAFPVTFFHKFDAGRSLQ